MSLDKPPVMKPEEFAEFVAKTKQALSTVQTTSEEVALIKTLVPQLQLSLEGVKAYHAERGVYTPSGTDAEVERKYCTPQCDVDDLPGAVIRDARGSKATMPVWAEKGETINAKDGRLFMVSKDHGAVRMLGGPDEAGVWEDGLLDNPKPESEWQHELQRRMEVASWHKAIREDGKVPPGVLRSIARHMRKGPQAIRRVFDDNATEGGEWIVTIPLAQLERTAELMRQLEGMFQVMNLTGPSNTHPFLTGGVQPFVRGTNTAGDMNPAEFPKSMLTTGERSVTPKTFTIALPYDLDAIEDSIVDAIPVFNDIVARGSVDGFEDAMINGDSAATHGDTGIATWNPRGRWQVLGSGLDHRRAFIGLRQRAFDVDANVSTAVTAYDTQQTVADYMGALSGLSSPHAFGGIFYLTSPEQFLAKVLKDTNLLTVDKYGPSATIVTGEVGKIGGRRILLSDFVPIDLAATGLYTGSGATTCMLIVNADRFRVARRRSFTTGIEVKPLQNMGVVYSHERKTFHTFDANTIANVRNLINLSIAP